MDRKLPNHRLAAAAALLCALSLSGCGGWRVPAIDPTGQRIFAPGGTYTTFEPRPLQGFSRPAFTVPPAPQPCPDIPPTLPPSIPPVAAAPAIVAPPVASPDAALAAPLIAPPPAAPVIAGPPAAAAPTSLVSNVRGSIMLTPTRLIAPVGSEVVLKAGLCGGDGYYVTDQRIDWALSQESVGHLVDVGHNDQPRGVGLFGSEPPAQRDATYAEARTTSQNVVVPRSSGNVQLLSGQTWVSVSSLAEGVSRVAAMAPNSPYWDGRRQTAVIEWIDAQWSAPAPAIVRSGQQHTLTTNLTRSTDGTPLVGWIVRYEILDGPPAQFVSYEGITGAAADATTDSNGQASVTIAPTTNQPGATRVRIQILRPASPDGSRAAIAVGNAETSVTWSAPGLSVSIAGPQQVSAGQAATYNIEIRNPGDMPVTNVEVTHVLSPEMSYLGSSPAGSVFGNRIQWQFPAIDPGMVMAIDVSCRAESGGDVAHLVTVACAEGLNAEASTVTRVLQNGLSVRMTGPVTAQVGQQVTFQIAVTNVGRQAIGNVSITDELGPGFQHAQSADRLERPLGDIGPGETVDFPLTLTVVQAGEICHAINVTGDGGHFASARACLSATAAAPVAPPAPPVGVPQPNEPSYTLNVAAPQQAQVGQIVQFVATVVNTGNTSLTNVRITSAMDPQLVHTFAEPGFQMMAGGIFWNVPQLPVGHQVAVRVQARCGAANPRACHHVTVDCDQLDPQASDGCLAIGPAAAGAQSSVGQPTPADPLTRPDVTPAAARRTDVEADSRQKDVEADSPEGRTEGLQVQLSAQRKSILVGDGATYIVELRNARGESDQQVRLTLRLPKSLRFEHLLAGPVETQSVSAAEGEEETLVTFTPIRELRAGERVTFRIRLRSRQSGRAEITATATSRSQLQPAAASTLLMVQ